MSTVTHNREIKYYVTVQGLKGQVVNGRFGPKLHGKWASHTGYRSLASGIEGVPLSELEAVQLAHKFYSEHAAYPFVVGEEHKAHGWKSIHINIEGCVEIRLPDWHEGVVKETVEAMGMRLTNSLNHFWSFPESVTLVDAKKTLAPILCHGTRFTDERILAEALKRTGAASGLLCRQEQLGFAF